MSLRDPRTATGLELAARALLGFLAFAFVPVLVFVAANALVVGAGRGTERELELQLAAQGCGAFAVLTLALWMPTSAAFRTTARQVLRTAMSYLCFAFPWLLFVLGYTLLLERLGAPLEPQPHLAYFTRPGGWDLGFFVALLVVTLVGPLAEEVLFRGWIAEALTHRLGPWPGEIVAAALFGLLHGVKNALPIALLGLFFAILRRGAGSLAPAALAHILHNSLTVALAMSAPKLLPTLPR